MLLLMQSLMLTGCCTASGVNKPAPGIVYQHKVVDTACDWTKPIYVSEGDLLTNETAATILAYNRTGQKVCGWKARSKQEDAPTR